MTRSGGGGGGVTLKQGGVVGGGGREDDETEGESYVRLLQQQAPAKRTRAAGNKSGWGSKPQPDSKRQLKKKAERGPIFFLGSLA